MKPLDLNLLRLLVALERTRHLGRAAESVGMSQSGFSTALSRLRTQLGDDLYVRGAGGMKPTPRALALAQTARDVLQQIEADVAGAQAFDPARSAAEFRLSMSDVAEVVFMPRLVAHCATVAPGLSLHTSPPSITPLRERLAAGEVDLALGYFPDLERDAYFRQALFSHTYACLLRCDHPAATSGLTRAAYAALGHVAVVSPARSNALLEQAIERERIRRRIVVTTPHHLSLPAIVASSDLVATVPLGMAVDAAGAQRLLVRPLPFKPPVFTIYQYWHRRTHREPGHHWLRQQVRLLFNHDSDPYGSHGEALYGNVPAARRPRRTGSTARGRAA